MLIFPFLALPAMAEPVTLLAFGDSLTQGYGLPQGAGLVPQLEAWLEAQGEDVDIINAGVSGDTTAGGAARIDWSLSDDVDAVMVALGGNDLLRGMDPAAMEANLSAILDAIEARDLPVLLVGQRATPNFGTAYREAFDAVYADLAEERGTLIYPDFMSALFAARDAGTDLRTLMQGDGIHPSPRGVELVVEDLGPSVQELLTLAREP